MRISLAQMTQLMVVIPIVVYVHYILLGWNRLYWVGFFAALHFDIPRNGMGSNYVFGGWISGCIFIVVSVIWTLFLNVWLWDRNRIK